MSLLNRIGKQLERGLWEVWRQANRPSEGLGVAVSGGVDSMVLLRACNLLHQANPLFPTVTVLHFDHQMRPESGKDALFVGRESSSLNLECLTGRANNRLEETWAMGTEESARADRYAWLSAIAKKHGLAAILTAHHRDDQLETISLGLLRGGQGTAVIHGMAACRQLDGETATLLLRPFLEVSRQDIEAWAKALGISHRVDPTNASTRFTRNRLRREVLPELSQAHTNLSRRILKIGTDARDVEEQCESLLESASAFCSEKLIRAPGVLSITWDLGCFRKLPSPLAHRILCRATVQLEEGEVAPTQKAMTFLSAGVTGSHELSRALHLSIDTSHNQVTLRRRVPLVIPDAQPLSLPGRLETAHENEVFEATYRENATPTYSAHEQWLPLGAILGSLHVRALKPEERMTPFGMDGSKRILDILQEAGVPSDSRRARLGIADSGGMLWYPGIVASERCRVHEKTALVALRHQSGDLV